MKVINIRENHKIWPQVQKLFPDVMKWRADKTDKGDYHFICAVDSGARVNAAMAMDIGPMAIGPLKNNRIAFIEGLAFRVGHDTKSGPALIKNTLRYLKAKGCKHVRGQISYKQKGALQVMQKLGFATVPIDNPGERCKTNQYLVVKSL